MTTKPTYDEIAAAYDNLVLEKERLRELLKAVDNRYIPWGDDLHKKVKAELKEPTARVKKSNRVDNNFDDGIDRPVYDVAGG